MTGHYFEADELPPVEAYEPKSIVPGAPWDTADPSLLDDGRREAPAFPYTLLGDWGPWVERRSDGAGCPGDFIASALLASAAGVIGNSRWVSPWPSWKEPSCLWVGLIGLPSSGKTAAVNAMGELIDPIEEILAEGFPDKLDAHEKDCEIAKLQFEQWKDELKTAQKERAPEPDKPVAAREPDPLHMPRIRLGDVTIERICNIHSGNPKGVLVCHDELASFFASFERYTKSSDRPFWLTSFTGSRHTVDRVKLGDKPQIIPRLTNSLLGGIQPAKLSSLMLKTEDGDDGMMSRMLLTWPSPIFKDGDDDSRDDSHAKRAFLKLSNLSMASDQYGKPEPVIVPLSAAAKEIFKAWRRENHLQQLHASGFGASHLGKGPGLVARLSLILELLWWSISPQDTSEPHEVSERAISSAAALFDEYFWQMACRVYGDASLPVEQQSAATLAKVIVREKCRSINSRDIAREWRLPGLRDADSIKGALNALEDAGWVKPDPDALRPDRGPGRRKTTYLVNPSVWSQADG